MRGAECGKCGVWKMRGVENIEQISVFHFNFSRKAEKQCVNNWKKKEKEKNTMNHCILRCAGLGW